MELYTLNELFISKEIIEMEYSLKPQKNEFFLV